MAPKVSDYYLGTDVGGTFTDIVFYSEDGDVSCIKVPSTPSVPARSTLIGVDELKTSRVLDLAAWGRLRQTHSSTIATNALIERTGAVVGLLVTEGFRDVLELQRLAPPDASRFDSRRPTPLVPRRRVREVRGRLHVSGRELTPIDEDRVVSATDALLEAGVEVIAVCLLHSYAGSAHELAVKAIIERSHPGVPVELSSSVWPQAREFERATLTAMNCHVRPVIQRYIDGLVEGMAHLGVATEVHIARSNGGMQRAATLRTAPIVAVLSGPAAGVSGAAGAAAAAGWDDADLITFDVGGTSADVGVVRGGQPLLSSDERVAEFPLLIPTVAVSSIGAGGGSILWLDESRKLQVGPKSVGAVPGPACYGTGSTVPALTDAFLVAGLLSVENKLGGRISLDQGAARGALAPLAARMQTSVEATADAAIAIGTAMMAAEVIKALAKHGADAPNFRMVAFGGAGPMVAALVANEAHMASVLIPPYPGALSAMGAALASAEGDLVEPVYARLDQLDPEALRTSFSRLEDRARAWLETEGQQATVAGTSISFSCEMRYEGQGYDLNVPIDPTSLAASDIAAIAAAFEGTHQNVYGYVKRQSHVRLQELRAHAIARLRNPSSVATVPSSKGTPTGTRGVRFWGRAHATEIYERSSIGVGQTVVGPAILTQMDTTTVIPPGWEARATTSGSLILRSVAGAADPASARVEMGVSR